MEKDKTKKGVVVPKSPKESSREMDLRMQRRNKQLEEFQKMDEAGTMQLGPGFLSQEQRKLLDDMMKEDQTKNPAGYKKGGMVTRGQGCVTRKKSCKMC